LATGALVDMLCIEKKRLNLKNEKKEDKEKQKIERKTRKQEK